MLNHCANPNCKKPLHYLRDGKVFLFSRKNSSKQNSKPPFQLLEHYWLCGKCTREWTLTMDGEQGVQLSEKTRHRFRHTYQGQHPVAVG